MKSLYKNQSGVAHLLVVVVFVITFAGLAGLAYSRISDKQTTTSKAVDLDAEDSSDAGELETAENEDLSPEEAADAEAGGAES